MHAIVTCCESGANGFDKVEENFKRLVSCQMYS